jgi:hypothetical protein
VIDVLDCGSETAKCRERAAECLRQTAEAGQGYRERFMMMAESWTTIAAMTQGWQPPPMG